MQHLNLTEEQKALWEKVQAFDPDDPDSSFTFSDRLARENGWRLDYALRVITEYKKFIFLICIAPHTLTPSDEVDQAWHLHLLYTRSYWEDLCEKILHRKIHHGPTKGGRQEGMKYRDLYERTKAFYAEKFGAPPPADIWPGTETRFREIDFVRVNRRRNWIIAKPNFKFT